MQGKRIYHSSQKEYTRGNTSLHTYKMNHVDAELKKMWIEIIYFFNFSAI